jgi:CubicO group peptidase (beta-lactamase class C family)
MAMLGYLYLNNGRMWKDQVVSQAWVKASTQTHATGHPEWFGEYGFHWWVSPQGLNHREDMFFALGSHGQYIFVIPAQEAVVAFRKKPGRKQDVMLPQRILFDKVLPCL